MNGVSLRISGYPCSHVNIYYAFINVELFVFMIFILEQYCPGIDGFKLMSNMYSFN